MLFEDGSHVPACVQCAEQHGYTVSLVVHPRKRLRKLLRAAVRIATGAQHVVEVAPGGADVRAPN